MNEKEFKNCRILIRNTEDGEIIADAKIIRFNSVTNSVFISGDSLAEKKPYRISALIFAEGCLYECFGTIRGGIVNNEIEVCLGKRKEKESRARTRYPLETEGRVNRVAINGRWSPLSVNKIVHTVNMSANGILIRADAGCFRIGDGFSLILGTEEKGMEMLCKVVRTQKRGMWTEEFGCRIIEVRRRSETEPQTEK